MRVSLAILAFLLVVAALHTEANTEPAQISITCCFSYTTRKIPISFVQGYERASNRCSKPAVVFHTKKGCQICANPSKPWVQEYIRYLDSKSESSRVTTTQGP